MEHDIIASVLGGLLAAALVASAATSVTFFRQWFTFVTSVAAANHQPFPAYLAAGIWLCATGTTFSFLNGMCVLLQWTGSPLGPDPKFFSVILAGLAFTFTTLGYGLHCYSWHVGRQTCFRHWGKLCMVALVSLAVISGVSIFYAEAYSNSL